MALQLRLGDAAAVAKTLGIVADEKAKPQDRAMYAQIFGQIREPRCVPVLLAIATKSRDDSLGGDRGDLRVDSGVHFFAPERSRKVPISSPRLHVSSWVSIIESHPV